MSSSGASSSKLQDRAWKEINALANATLGSRAEAASHHAYTIVKSRQFSAVPEENEIALVFQAAGDNDLELLHAFIRHGEHYPLGCVQRTVLACRGAGLSVDAIGTAHLDAAQTMIAAVLDVARADFAVNLNDNDLRERYEVISDYAVVNHREVHLIASMVRDRKMDRLDDVERAMKAIRENKALSVAEGYL